MSDFGLIINGEMVSTAESFGVINPATEKIVGQCPIASREQLDAAVSAAAEAYKSWSRVSDEERAAACGRIAAAINDHADELATLLTQEQGKPIGGVKCSGIGVEFGEEGLAEYTSIQIVNVAKSAA
jgi:acyl-CoA reductase-like NAD-dependent aldehyde dehydrogenase